MGDIQTRISERFCANDADITFLSCDGVLISIHRKNLETHAGGFPPSEFKTQGEIIPLSETSTTLELLFQFIYPQKYPDLRSEEIGILAPVAEAAEKYEVYSAMSICEIHMRNFIRAHPLEVLVYAARHSHLDILDEVAPLAIEFPLQDVLVNLPQSMVVSWALYYEQWVKVHLAALKGAHRCKCGKSKTWVINASKILSRLSEGLGSLLKIDPVFEECSVFPDECCTSSFDGWRQQVKNKISLVPTFRALL